MLLLPAGDHNWRGKVLRGSEVVMGTFSPCVLLLTPQRGPRDVGKADISSWGPHRGESGSRPSVPHHGHQRWDNIASLQSWLPGSTAFQLHKHRASCLTTLCLSFLPCKLGVFVGVVISSS